MKIRTGNAEQWQNLARLENDVNRAYNHAHAMRDHIDMGGRTTKPIQYVHSFPGDNILVKTSWGMRPEQIEALRERAVTLAGPDSAAVTQLAHARDTLTDARASFDARKFVAAGDHANTTINHLNSAEDAVRALRIGARPGFSGGAIAGALALTGLAVGGGIALSRD